MTTSSKWQASITHQCNQGTKSMMFDCNCETDCDCIILSWPFMKQKPVNFLDREKAGGILIYDNKILLVQSRGNLWGFPKGGIEPGELPIESAIREVMEETSLVIPFTDDDPKFFINNTIFFIKHLDSVPMIDTVAIRNLISNDCSGIAWIDVRCLMRKRHHSVGYNSSLRKFLWFMKKA